MLFPLCPLLTFLVVALIQNEILRNKQQNSIYGFDRVERFFWAFVHHTDEIRKNFKNVFADIYSEKYRESLSCETWHYFPLTSPEKQSISDKYICTLQKHMQKDMLHKCYRIMFFVVIQCHKRWVNTCHWIRWLRSNQVELIWLV